MVGAYHIHGSSDRSHSNFLVVFVRGMGDEILFFTV